MTPDERARLEALERQMRDHFHSGHDSERINLRDILGAIEVVDAAPTGKPQNIGGQLKVYKNGATLRLYWYDTKEQAWHYVTATA